MADVKGLASGLVYCTKIHNNYNVNGQNQADGSAIFCIQNTLKFTYEHL